jgi:hypothetical protein
MTSPLLDSIGCPVTSDPRVSEGWIAPGWPRPWPRARRS